MAQTRCAEKRPILEREAVAVSLPQSGGKSQAIDAVAGNGQSAGARTRRISEFCDTLDSNADPGRPRRLRRGVRMGLIVFQVHGRREAHTQLRRTPLSVVSLFLWQRSKIA